MAGFNLEQLQDTIDEHDVNIYKDRDYSAKFSRETLLVQFQLLLNYGEGLSDLDPFMAAQKICELGRMDGSIFGSFPAFIILAKLFESEVGVTESGLLIAEMPLNVIEDEALIERMIGKYATLVEDQSKLEYGARKRKMATISSSSDRDGIVLIKPALVSNIGIADEEFPFNKWGQGWKGDNSTIVHPKDISHKLRVILGGDNTGIGIQHISQFKVPTIPGNNILEVEMSNVNVTSRARFEENDYQNLAHFMDLRKNLGVRK